MDRVESQESKVESQRRNFGFRISDFGLRQAIAPCSLLPAPRSSRRGVLLLVVLSMLVLFMLIGTAFLMTSNQARTSAKYNARGYRLGNRADELLDRALMHALRDTENPAAATHTHSLLRDFYGTDGFQVLIYQPPSIDFTLANGSGQATRYAGALAATSLGPTLGQFIDIYVGSVIPNAGDSIDLRHTLKLDRNVLGQPQLHTLPLTKGYYNGCLLTVTTGPAAGQSSRIVDYEFVGQFNSGNPSRPTRLLRFRVMAFGRSDGRPLQIGTSQNPPQRVPELVDLAGASFIVNGRPFNGTGVGYNALAVTGQARLTAMQAMATPAGFVGAETALTPHARYLDYGLLAVVNPTAVLPPGADHFAIGGNLGRITDSPSPAYIWLNDPAVAPALWPYQSFVGPGDADEGYDAADFQNMWLALQTVTPRAQGRVVHTGVPLPFDVNHDSNNNGVPDSFENSAAFLRLDLEDVPLPSFHRPDLVNFWYHRVHALLVAGRIDENDAVRAILQPYNANWQPQFGLNSQQAALIAGIKRKIMMRPIREDHPKFDGSNTQSLAADLSSAGNLVVGGNIAVPYWEAVGPWDVDNDNDGVPDSVWVDLGDPVIELEDGTRVKAMYAYLIIDLDGRLNVNAHGLVDHIVRADLARVQYPGNPNYVTGPNLAGGGPVNSNHLPQGLGMGPPEISLRPVFPAPTIPTPIPNRVETSGNPPQEIDSYAALLAGRVTLDGVAVPGKYGYLANMSDQQKVAPGYNYDFNAPGWRDSTSPTGDTARPDLAAQMKFFDYPWVISQRSAFGTPPDLFGRYALGLDYTGQPYYEVLNDVNPATQPLPQSEWRSNHLLVNSPYELNLSRSQRREAWSSANFADANQAFTASLAQNDDAPYSPADLERVLRAWDADSGTLPSRLWDVVDAFDPLKLLQYDNPRMFSLASTVFGSTADPEMLATAQQVAGINRRLVTTDSFDPPVPAISPPAYLLTVPDVVPPAFKQAYFVAINRKPPSSMAEMLELRIRRAYAGVQWPPTPFDDYDPNGDHDLDGTLNTVDPEFNNGAAQTARLTRAAQINTIIQQLLAPDLLAGKRLDLNRPFGDGRDNNVNGVVDDPLEAGEPFLDVNGNGKCDPGEPFINLDGSLDASNDPSYTLPLDQLWADLTATGTLTEPIAFDYTNGIGYPVHIAVTNSLGIAPNLAPNVMVRNLESQGRQLYARHLYCLMLTLVDENYIAPWDENDPQIKELLDKNDAKSQLSVIRAALQALPTPPPDPEQEARRIVLRKLTCRAIAQWAVNCVDMRDADAIMTPFEYDENPWDGWGCVGATGIPIPLDGDPATDENKVEMIDWNGVVSNNYTKTISKMGDLVGQVDAPTPLDETRGLVWGAERPELLITETIAFHDRRTEDLDSDFTTKDMLNEGTVQDTQDLDQRLRPRGSLFIEIYNPWSPTGQYPAELYSQLTRNPPAGSGPPTVGVAPSDGIQMDRLSTLGVNANGQLSNEIDTNRNAPTATVKRTPVWRVIAVEEHPKYRNDDTVDDTGSLVHTGAPKSRYSRTAPGFFEAADIDWPRFDSQVVSANEPYVERSFYFTTDNSDRYKKDQSPGTRLAPNSPAAEGNNERFLLVKKADDKLRLPPESTNSARYFLAAHAVQPAGGNIPDVTIAPIKPGRYAIIGTAGAQYKGGLEFRTSQKFDQNGKLQTVNGVPRYVTTVSRLIMPGQAGDRQTDDATHRGAIDRTRRIELLPYFDPEVQQVFIGSNGGTPLFPNPGNNAKDFIQRDNEVVKLPFGPTSKRFLNIFDGDDNEDPASFDPDGIPDPTLIAPCVAIPVAHMSLSEPLDLYKKRRADLYAIEKGQEQYANSQSIQVNLKDHYWNPNAAEGEGAYVDGQNSNSQFESPYDEPFDTAWELMRNGTTRNYRTLHLQRLADPTLPWNPLPTLPDGKPNPAHNPKLPVNVYRTIDTASADLTSFNGASSREPDDPDQSVIDRNARWLPEKYLTQFRNTFGTPGLTNSPFHRLSFRSLERGLHATDATTVGGELAVVPRALWRQEPEMRFDPADATKNDMLNWRTLTSDAQRQTELAKRANDLRVRDRSVIDSDIKAIAAGMDPDFTDPNFPDKLRPGSAAASGRGHQFDIVMDHSLGFQNEAFGALATRADVQQQNLAIAASGTPLLDSGFARSTLPPYDPNSSVVDDTFPWLAWGNRPFVSTDELLNVPGTSSSQMLRKYSTINSNLPAANQPNPYNGLGTNTVAVNLALSQAPFGHLLNAFQTSSLPAIVSKSAAVWQFTGAPHFYRILEYVHVPSRYVGTDNMLTAEIFNDNPFDNTDNIASAQDPRYYFQPPFNKVSRERDPGQVNLNTVTGRRIPPVTGSVLYPARIWSEVYDGIMHSDKDGWNVATGPLPHMGPAWRDVVVSRRGYAQFNADGTGPIEKPASGQFPDVFASGLNPNFPSMFSNPFRSPDSGDLVPLPQMMQYGVDVSFQRVHPYTPGPDGVRGSHVPPFTGARGAGFDDDLLSYRGDGAIPNNRFDSRDIRPLFSESIDESRADTNRNPAMMYQPMTRMENLVTNRSNVFAIWITVGYFEVEPAPNWNDPDNTVRQNVRERFGGTLTDSDAATVAAQALYNRVYPDGYMLGREVGSETGDVKRPRGFYVIDRTEEVGFKPGEDLNVDKTIRLKRRIE